MTVQSAPQPTATHQADLVAATAAAREFLIALGVDVAHGDTAQTPQRMARAYHELLTPESWEWTTFTHTEKSGGLAIVSRIAFASLCEHHMLPFLGTADLGYLVNSEVAGLSKIARLVSQVSQRPQVQERMTTQLADALEAELVTDGVAVRIQAEHLCMSLRGARARGAHTTTSVLRGRLGNDHLLHQEWLTAIGRPA